jgi:ribosome recycling factor
VIRVPLPVLTGERRAELIKAAGKYAEGTRVAIRGVRRDGMEQVKGFEKKKDISEDDSKAWADEVQKLTDQYVKSVDQSLADKEKDIRQV